MLSNFRASLSEGGTYVLADDHLGKVAHAGKQFTGEVFIPCSQKYIFI